MKNKRNIISITLVALLLTLSMNSIGQSIPKPHAHITDLKGKKVSLNELTSSNEKTIVIFWESNNKKHIDFLEQLNEMHEMVFGDARPKIIAISSDRFHSRLAINTLVAARDWEIEIYVDVNKTFKHLNGISDELRTYTFENEELIRSNHFAIPGIQHPLLASVASEPF